jgi:hypothetical protein
MPNDFNRPPECLYRHALRTGLYDATTIVNHWKAAWAWAGKNSDGLLDGIEELTPAVTLYCAYLMRRDVRGQSMEAQAELFAAFELLNMHRRVDG